MEKNHEATQTLMDNYDNKRQRPKHLERILLANHKEQLGLQRRLDFINNCSKNRGKELDRERFKVSTELQYNKRINYHTITPYLEKVPLMLKDAYPHSKRIDPVTVFLLREYKRNSEVIPDILAQLQMDEDERRARLKKQALGQMEEPTEPQVSGYRNKAGDPDPQKLADLVREISRIRNDILTTNRVQLSRSRMTFEELLRYVQDREKLGSDSATYTDGTCALLRRKMNKMRQWGYHSIGLEEDHTGLKVKYIPPPRIPKIRKLNRKVVTSTLMRPPPPSIQLGRSHTVTSTTSNKHPSTSASTNSSLQEESEMRRLLEQQERLVTDQKVAKEIEQYEKIHSKIVDFLEKNRRKTQLPYPL